MEITDYIPAGLNLTGSAWAVSGNIATRVIPGPISANGGSAFLDIFFVVSPNFTGSSLVNYAEISAADDDTDPGNTPPVDIDSEYDQDNTNDAGGQPNSPADNTITGDGSGTPGSGLAAFDEDDHDPALIFVNGDCEGLTAGANGFIDVCLTCNTNSVVVDLFGALQGNPSPNGSWSDDDNTGISLADPSSVNIRLLPNGTYTFTYSVEAQGGCPATSAMVTVTLSSNFFYACNNLISVPLGNACKVPVTPSMVLTGGGSGCSPDGFEVNLIRMDNGQSIGDTITADLAGQTLIAEVIDPYCGLVCAGQVYVQDITPPSLSCPAQNVELICTDIDSILNNPNSLAVTGEPVIGDDCGLDIRITFQDQLVTGLPDCSDKQVNRTFRAEDPLGNVSQCTQQITIRRPTLSDVILPASPVEIPCDEDYPMDANGNPAPSVSGFPMMETHFGPLPVNQSLCNIGATYQDAPPIVVCEGTFRIVRKWTILDWCAPQGSGMLEFSQVIKVGDVDGPVVSCPNIDYNGDGQPDELTYSSSPYACTASFEVPLPVVSDNCSGWEVYTDIVTDEVVPITNQYGMVIGYDTIASVVASIAPGASRYVSGIPLGCHRFRYKVVDDCNNYTTVECNFCVIDNVEPTAVCNDDLNISIGGQGYGMISASQIDEGSSDNCGIDTMLVRRRFGLDPQDCSPITPYFSEWAPYVEFSCCDAGRQVTIELLVIDLFGNQNTCSLEVLIEDKVRPDCIAPNDVEVSCNDLPANFDPTDASILQETFGAAFAEDDCGDAVIEELEPVISLDDCDVGTILRNFRAVDEAGNTSQNTCRQVITITREFNYEIKFPKDVTVECEVPEPDTLLLNNLACGLLSVSVTDEVFTPTPGSADPSCYKIFRKYRVMNDCEYDGSSAAVVVSRDEDCDGTPGDEDVWVVRRPSTAYIDRDDNHTNSIPAFGVKGTNCDGSTNPSGYWRTSPSVGLWEYTQIIKVVDNTPPVISFTEPDVFCGLDAENCNGAVVYPFTVSEECSAAGISVQVFLDANADGTIDQELTGNALSGSYPNYSIQGDFPFGTHAFVVVAEDACGGNSVSARLPFEVVDCAPPAFTCLNGLSANLSALPPDTDIDGDGEFDLAGVSIWAKDFVPEATDCSDDTIAYSINLAGEVPDINQRSLSFTCADTGTVDIEIYVWDSADNPTALQPDGSLGGFNYGVCETYIVVQDNNNLCEGLPAMAGLIVREDQAAVEGVEVSLSGQMNMMMNTSLDGSYEFYDLEPHYDYTITPYLDLGHRNGVSTFDLLIIQKHLLGEQPLGSPYKLIAADANRSGNVTTLDMIEIQKLILGELLEFSNNTSWRFIDANFDFPVPGNPWFTIFPEVININDLATDRMSNNFIAVKIGDVNNSAVTTSLNGVEGRSFAGTFELQVPELAFSKGELLEVPFTAAQLEAARGYQFTLDYGQRVLELVDVQYGLADEHSLGLHGLAEGYITASWYRKGSLASAGAGEKPLFTLYFRAQAAGRLSDLLRISSQQTLAEAYSPGNELLEVALEFAGAPQQAGPEFRLHQNRPNPFRSSTVIGFDLPEAGAALLSIYDLSGRLIRQYEGDHSQGYQEVEVLREHLPASGVYYYKLQIKGQVASRKMILLE